MNFMYNYYNTDSRVRAIAERYFNRDDLKVSNLKTIKKLLEHETTVFYASDIGFNGGIVNGLRMADIIRETGNKREIFVCIDEYEKLYKKSEIIEWELTIPKDILKECYINFISKFSL